MALQRVGATCDMMIWTWESRIYPPVWRFFIDLSRDYHLPRCVWLRRIPLLKTSKESKPFDKYSDNRFYTYLALDCTTVKSPRAMDDDKLL